MNGIVKIIAHIQSDAQAQAADILDAASAKADAITAEYAASAQDILAKSQASSKTDVDARISSMKRMNEMESKKKTLALKQEMVEMAFSKASQLIADMPEDEYCAFLKKLADEAVLTGDEEIILNAKDKTAIGEKLVNSLNEAPGRSIKLSDKTGDFAGGFILRRGNIEANCTLELIIETKRAELSSEVAKVLFS